VSVPVGFFQASTSLIAPAPGTTRPDGTPADGSAEGAGAVGLFAALLAMIAPGAQPPADAETATSAIVAPAVAAAPAAIVPPAEQPPVPVAPQLPQLTDLQQSEAGKALLKDFTDALKAARSALDQGEPLDPALEKKLTETIEAIAAWFAGAPQLQPAPVDTGKLAELASGSNILPAIPAGDLPPPPPASDAPDAPLNPGPVAVAEPAPKVMQAQIVPQQLAELGTALKDFAAQLEKASPELARAMAQLADRIAVGDIADDAMAQLGLARTPGSTSPELEQLVAALTAKPATRPAAAAATAPIAPPVLDLPETLAGQTAVASASPEAKPAEAPRPDATQPDSRTSETKQPAPVVPTTDLELDAEVKLDVRARPDDEPAVADSRPAGPAPASARPDAAPPAAAPLVTNADAAAQGAQATAAATTAPTGTRAIHAAYSAPVQQLNYPQVAFEVARHFEAGNTRFQIRLDPADLGRIDVKLDLDKSGTVSAHMFVERPETLDLMMRDQRALQQALQQAGLDASKTSLEFSLRQNPFGTGADTGQGNGGNSRPGFGPFGTAAADETELAAQTLYRASASQSGLNLFV